MLVHALLIPPPPFNLNWLVRPFEPVGHEADTLVNAAVDSHTLC